MVIPDADARRSQVPLPPTESNSLDLAPPLHRLAAVIVDTFIVLAPIYMILCAPLKRAMTVNVFVGSIDPVFYSLSSLAIALTLGVSYQTLMHWRFGWTVGKRLFGLEVRTVSGSNCLSAHFVRSLGWMASVGSSGIPFLAVWSHPRRRPLHDRLAETVVVTRGNGVDAPSRSARDLVRAAYALVAVFVLLSGLGALTTLHSRASDEAGLARAEAACEAVSNAMVEGEAGEHARLELALTLYSAGLAERSCLESEVEREAATGAEFSALGYLAQSFVNADDAEVSNAYLDRVCADGPESAECAMSAVVSHWSNEDWTGVETDLERAPKGRGYLEVWGIRHDMHRARFARALAGLDRLIDRPELSDYTLPERVRALYGAARWPEAREAFKQAASVLTNESARELSAWSCVQEFSKGCGAVEEVACRRIEKLERDEDDSSALALAHLRADECRTDADVDYLDLASSAKSDDWAALYRGSAKINGADRAGAVALLSRVIDSDSADDVLRVEAVRRLGLVASVDEVRETWKRLSALDQPAVLARARLAMTKTLQARGDQALEALVAPDALPSPRAPASAERE